MTVSENTYSYFSMGEVFDAPLLHGLAELDLSGYGFLPATMRALVESPIKFHPIDARNTRIARWATPTACPTTRTR